MVMTNTIGKLYTSQHIFLTNKDPVKSIIPRNALSVFCQAGSVAAHWLITPFPGHIIGTIIDVAQGSYGCHLVDTDD